MFALKQQPILSRIFLKLAYMLGNWVIKIQSKLIKVKKIASIKLTLIIYSIELLLFLVSTSLRTHWYYCAQLKMAAEQCYEKVNKCFTNFLLQQRIVTFVALFFKRSGLENTFGFGRALWLLRGVFGLVENLEKVVVVAEQAQLGVARQLRSASLLRRAGQRTEEPVVVRLAAEQRRLRCLFVFTDRRHFCFQVEWAAAAGRFVRVEQVRRVFYFQMCFSFGRVQTAFGFFFVIMQIAFLWKINCSCNLKSLVQNIANTVNKTLVFLLQTRNILIMISITN